MKFLIIFVVALAFVSASVLPAKEIKSRNLVVPAGRPESRITHGHEASIGQFPYQVGLFLTSHEGKTTWCGGSLLNNKFVLTAAHCIDDSAKVLVLLGATDRWVAEIEHTVTDRNITIHPEWNATSLANDISLIEIPFTQYTKKIQPVKLPSKDMFYSAYNGDDVIASGWGRIYDKPKVDVKRLQWAHMNVIPNRICKAKLSSVLPSNICVSTYNKVSICQGDSGGPLVLQSSRIQVGISSFVAEKGCEKGYPAAFTRVTSYLDWIQQHTGVSY